MSDPTTHEGAQTAGASPQKVAKWDRYELTLEGPATGNPFRDVKLAASFQFRNRIVEVDGFYDGAGRYLVRFMPDREGEWRFVTRSNVADLDGRRGRFVCVAPTGANHGPVRVADRYHFRYADGTRYLPFGTTCYHWTHAMDAAEEDRTLASLAASPFNKVRMCLLPTSGMRPPRLAFVGDQPGALDKERFDPEFFQHLEARIDELAALGIEADLILFHPYDKGHWGVDNMTPEQDRFLLRYVIARLAAFRNVWWSISNEYDFNRAKTVQDWDDLLCYVQRRDPYQRLRSIHNGTRMYERSAIYDFTKPWLTHQSIQHWDAALVEVWRAQCPKPVVVDEISYEGDIERRWGNITGRELTRRFWRGTVAGGYVGHGECFADPDASRWVSTGGTLRGESTERIGFLRRVVEEGPADWIAARAAGTYFLDYLGDRQPAHHDLDLPDADFQVDVLDTWAMTVSPLEGKWRGRCRIPLGRPDLAVRARRVDA